MERTSWRSKFIFVLIVYFAGFASAIYCLAPVPDEKDCQFSKDSFAYSVLKSDRFAKSFNTGMRKCLYYGKNTAKRLSVYVNKKFGGKH